MTKKSKTYQLYIALLLCFFQVAGIDVYAQEPVKTVQDSISPVREAPKARARRHREPVVSSPVADSVKVDKAVILQHRQRDNIAYGFYYFICFLVRSEVI